MISALKQFERTPLINKSLCDQISLKNCGEENEPAHSEVARKVREEFMVLRNREKKDAPIVSGHSDTKAS